MENTSQTSGTKRARSGRTVDRLFKVAVIVIAAFIVGVTFLAVGRMAVYKIHAYERGLHLRGGRFIGEDQPGWHVQIPLVDTVIRAELNQEIMEALKAKAEQYGVRFVTIQMQSASPPDEVVQAIKERMVAVQRQEQAQAEAEQTETLANAEFYAAQKRADAEAYQITKKAEAQQAAVRMILAELDKRGDIGQKYIEYMIAQELKENSKWIISGEGTPIIDLRETPQEAAEAL
jgi:regulator of protease activity HflC (stomatin/prohibitin superfamily)